MSVVPDVGQEIPKLQGKIHVGHNEMHEIAAELVQRKVCKWIPLSQVLTFRGEKVLNGLFGVEKSSRTESGKPVLRLIMNLVPSNSVLRNYVGAVKNLPQITSWLNLTLEADEQVRVWQSDMSNAFYLFKLPDGWGANLAFNVVREGSLIGEEKGVDFALSCSVLPMGWSNSVSLMQEASENILLFGNLDKDAQISRGSPLPPWITGMVHTANNSGKAFWHVYLDNFAAGQIGGTDCNFETGNKLHQLAEQAWAEANVVSSVKKQRTAESQAQELGAHINGELQTIGGSPERLIKLVQATFYLLARPHLSRKLTQVVAGRWIHVFQFRRPAMSFLEATWEFSSSKGFNPRLIRRVRRELYSCMCALPFLHTFLGARISDVITASDSSSHGGAVGIARELTPEGEDYVASVGTFPRVKKIPVLVISLFNGIGGALRVYDMLGLSPVGIAVFDIHKPSNRVTAKRWPHAEVHGDVRELDKDLIQHWLRQYIPLSQVHLWAGFPCTDLSSVRYGRQGLEGPASGLFWEVVRIKNLLRKELPVHVTLKYVGENVASMDKKECERISEALEVKPYYLNPTDSVPMQRPRLCWTSEEIEGSMAGLTFVEKEYWTEVTADGAWPDIQQWITPGYEWPGSEQEHMLPTAMKSIPRQRPPPKPAGLNRCDWPTQQRWQADRYRFPPYHYQERFLFWRDGCWRLCNSSEKELLLGYGWGHTEVCYNASTIKSSKQQYEDERLSLLGDSFSIFSFCIPGAALCKMFLPKFHYSHLGLRMGMAPGYAAPFQLQAPIQRKLQYGKFPSTPHTVQSLNQYLLTKVNHTGSDIRITTGEVLSPKAVPRQSVQAAWWKWQPVFKNRWSIPEHINVLELRSIMLAAKYQILNLKQHHCRLFHITDSFVGLSVTAKGRTGSRQLGKVLKELNGWLLGFGVSLILGHVESSENPTDGASRALAFLQPAHTS